MRSCPQNGTVRNVFRVSFSDPRSLHYLMFKTYCNSYALGHTCPSGHTARHVFRASPCGSAEPLGQASGRPVRQGRPKTPERVRLGTVWAAKVPEGCPPDLTSACPRLCPNLRFAIPSVGWSSMHMERPDDIGREAGTGRTQDGKEPNDFRACP